MRFNFCGVYISWICNFCIFRDFKFAVAGYNGVEIFADIQSESVYHNSKRYPQRCKTCWTFWIRLKMSSYWMESCIWGFHIDERYGRLSLEKGLVAPAKEATEKIRSQLQWREALKLSAMYRARSRASLRSSCGSVGPYPVKLQGAADWASTYRHFSYAWRHWLAVAVYVSIYSDVQISADEIFADSCWSTKTANIKPRKN